MTGFLENPTYAGVFFGSLVIGLSGAVAPGPVLVRTIAHVPQHGFLTGPLMVLGHGILELALVMAILFGPGQVLTHDGVFTTIALAGGVVLLWMAYGMIRSLPTVSLSKKGSEATPNPGRSNLILDGILISAASPYWSLWWATIGLSLIAVAQRLGVWGLVFFYVGHISGDLAWYSLVSGVFAAGSAWMTDRFYRGVIGLCGVGLGVFGLLFVVEAGRRMMG